MGRLAEHDQLCATCIERAGTTHCFLWVTKGEDGNTKCETKEIVTCPLWSKDKSIAKWRGHRKRKNPMVLTRHHVPKGCDLALEHVLLEENSEEKSFNWAW
jgi:hypothetical protein